MLKKFYVMCCNKIPYEPVNGHPRGTPIWDGILEGEGGYYGGGSFDLKIEQALGGAEHLPADFWDKHYYEFIEA